MRHGLSECLVFSLIIAAPAVCHSQALADGAIQITFHPGDDQHPCWSPDGTEIAFESTRADTAGLKKDIWVIPATDSVRELN